MRIFIYLLSAALLLNGCAQRARYSAYETAPVPAPAPVPEVRVTNLQVGQDGDKAVATYDLAGGAGGEEAEVIVAITINGEMRTPESLRLSGDFGRGVKVGQGKQIVWDAVADLPPGFDGDIAWDVKVAADIPKPALKKKKAKKAKKKKVEKVDESSSQQ